MSWLLIVFPTLSYADGYSTIGGGGGGESKAGNVSLELGGISLLDGERKQLIAIGLGFIFGDDVPSDLLDYPVPHEDYTDLGKRQKGNEYGIFVKYGLELIENNNLFIFGLGGCSFAEEVDLARSNVTGWYYEQSSSTKTYGIFGVGFAYYFKENKKLLQIEYDNRRGITGSIGFFW